MSYHTVFKDGFQMSILYAHVIAIHLLISSLLQQYYQTHVCQQQVLQSTTKYIVKQCPPKIPTHAFQIHYIWLSSDHHG